MWIWRFTPTDLHLPLRLSRPPPAASRTPLPAGAVRAPQHQPGPHRDPRLSHPAAQERAREQDAASGYVRASPAHSRPAATPREKPRLRNGEREMSRRRPDRSKAP